jgi:hypothetical protein
MALYDAGQAKLSDGLLLGAFLLLLIAQTFIATKLISKRYSSTR